MRASARAGQHPRPRKRFGQHFLVDRGAAARIVELVEPGPDELVLEIGPGRGALTAGLLERLPRLVAVEIDRDLVADLNERFAGPRLRLIEGDVLGLDLSELVRQEQRGSLFAVGNLPFNITAPLLFRLLEQAPPVGRALLMMQREVARRLAAGPGSRAYGLLTVLLGQRAEIAIRLEVDRRAFRPVPQVQSTVVELRFRRAPRYPVQDEGLFTQVVRAAFGQRRKMLRNALLPLGPGVAVAAAAAGIDLERRAETLTIEEFGRLSDGLTAADAGE
jgi:16S rRNA (adenine1518-N6/adenine1519-N6)-dimethyltransferase